MTSKRKVMTVLAVLIVLSLVVLPATAFAGPPTIGRASGNAVAYKVTQPWKGKKYEFNVREQTLKRPPRGSMWAFKLNCGNYLWSIPKVSCVRVPDVKEPNVAFFGGKGRGKMRGKWVMVVAKEGKRDSITVRTTRNKRYFNDWCRRPRAFGVLYRWSVARGNVRVSAK